MYNEKKIWCVENLPILFFTILSAEHSFPYHTLEYDLIAYHRCIMKQKIWRVENLYYKYHNFIF
jgi:hypothetical protein